MGFLDNILGKDGDKKKDKKPMKNPFANLGGPRTFHGQGNSLGGTQPGIVIPISLPNPGPLGVRVEKRPNSQETAIVNEVVKGSQAEAAGMQRGDILCFAGSDGKEEMMYEMFLELAKSPQRPMNLEVRRLDGAGGQAGARTIGGGTPPAATKTTPTGGTQHKKSAEADHRRQAVIAAAEAREKAHKAKTKPLKTVTKTTLAREKQQQRLREAEAATSTTSEEPLSDAAKRAAVAAKQGEAQLAQQLGYNPYETARTTAGQARTATTTAQHGTIAATTDSAGDHLPIVAPPLEAGIPSDDGANNLDDELPIDFAEAYATMVSANSSESVQTTCGIMKKLLVNATTKGQTPAEDASKFRKVRLANSKIQAALVEVAGAVEVMLTVGFALQEQDGESVLMFPADYPGPDWLPAALQQLERGASSATHR